MRSSSLGMGDKEFCARIEQLASGIATVVATRPINSRFPEFIWDEALGFELILDHLLELGHRNIALLGGARADRTSNPTRLRQYQDTCEQRGIKPLIIVSGEKEDRIHSGQKMARELLATHPGITAVVGRNIEFSVGALSEFQRQGLQVPRDLSLVSYYRLQDCQRGLALSDSPAHADSKGGRTGC